MVCYTFSIIQQHQPNLCKAPESNKSSWNSFRKLKPDSNSASESENGNKTRFAFLVLQLVLPRLDQVFLLPLLVYIQLIQHSKPKKNRNKPAENNTKVTEIKTAIFTCTWPRQHGNEKLVGNDSSKGNSPFKMKRRTWTHNGNTRSVARN